MKLEAFHLKRWNDKRLLELKAYDGYAEHRYVQLPAAYYFSSNGMLQIQYSAVPRSWLNCTSCGVGGTSVVGQLCATLPALAVQRCHRSQLNPVFHSNSPWVRGFWEALWSAWQSQKLPFTRRLARDWVFNIYLSLFTAWIVSPSFFSHCVSRRMGDFFIGMIWLRGPASWNGLTDSYS